MEEVGCLKCASGAGGMDGDGASVVEREVAGWSQGICNLWDLMVKRGMRKRSETVNDTSNVKFKHAAISIGGTCWNKSP